MKLRLNDVRLRGCGFTLYPAATEFHVSDYVMSNILASIYEQSGALDENFDKQERIRKENPEFPQLLLSNSWLDECMEKAIADELLKRTEGGYSLTEKSIKIFEKAASIQSELDAKGFRCCPCHHYC